jgi:hypothetical protein
MCLIIISSKEAANESLEVLFQALEMKTLNLCLKHFETLIAFRLAVKPFWKLHWRLFFCDKQMKHKLDAD